MSAQLQVTGEAKIRDIQGPVVANDGVITALDGAASQYVRGDGTLADFPSSSGGGSSVSYYLNSSVSQGTIGGVAYRELSKEPIIGAGTDIPISANGYVANYITDVNDPDVILLPGGNFNCEFYFSVNNNTGSPSVYAELYKYNGTTFTLLGSSVAVPESINQGTTIAPYYFAIPVATATLALTDRLAIRIYVNVSGRTVTLHTENGHLCQVVTTLSKGMVSLNNLTDQSQYLTTGTSGTNFNIDSSGDTHTFNLPIASATNTGKLSSSDWSIFNNKVPYTGATTNVNLGIYALDASTLTAVGLFATNTVGTNAGILALSIGSTFLGYVGHNTIAAAANGVFVFTSDISSGSAIKDARFNFGSLTNNTTRTFDFPNESGTIALTSDLSAYVTLATTQTISGLKTFTALATNNEAVGIKLTSGVVSTGGYLTLNAKVVGTLHSLFLAPDSTTNRAEITFDNTALRTYSLPNASGTLALTSDIPSLTNYVTLDGTQTITGLKTFSAATVFSSTTTHSGVASFGTGSPTAFATDGTLIIPKIRLYNGTPASIYSDFVSAATTNRSIVVPDASGTLLLGTGTNNYISKFTSTGSTLGNSGIFDNGTNVIFGGTSNTSANPTVVMQNRLGTVLSVAGFNWAGTTTDNNSVNSLMVIGGYLNTSAQTVATATNASGMQFFNGGFYWYGNSGLTIGSVYTNTQRMFLTVGGNLIIGSGADAGFRLDVSGTARLTGALTATSGTFSSTLTMSAYSYADSALQFRRATTNTISPASGNGILVFGGGSSQIRINTNNAICFDMNNGGTPYTSLLLSQNGNTVLINSPDNTLSLGLGYQGTYHGFLGGFSSALYAYSTNGGQVLLNNTSAWIPVSDVNRKKNFETYNLGLNAILGLEAKLYHMDFQEDSEEKQVGLIAQQVREHIPQAFEQNDKFIGLNYNVIIVTLVNAIQELEARVKQLENK